MFLTTLMPSLNMLVDNSYASVKTLETEQLIADSLKNLTPVKNPSFCQVSGIPGAGKSTFCTKHLPKNCLFLSFDKLMLSLSIYQQTLKEQGAVAAFNKSEMTARIIGYELLSRAIDGHYNILFEHSGANPAHLELLKNLPQKGYKTAVNFIICNTDMDLPCRDGVSVASVGWQQLVDALQLFDE